MSSRSAFPINPVEGDAIIASFGKPPVLAAEIETARRAVLAYVAFLSLAFSILSYNCYILACASSSFFASCSTFWFIFSFSFCLNNIRLSLTFGASEISSRSELRACVFKGFGGFFD